jgi:nucleotide-binding universal stress UspA family protein
MPYKSIMTVVVEPGLARQAIAVAGHMAQVQVHDGHLDVLAMGYEPSIPSYSYVGATDVMAVWSLDEANAGARAASQAAKAAMAALPVGLRAALETEITVTGRLTATVADRAAYADLVVLAAARTKAQRELADTILEAALFQAHAPVLIVPEGVDASRVAQPGRVVLAWNQSAEALHAAKRALPLLRAAELVDVAVIDPPLAGAERSDPAGPLCQFLARHGVRVEVSVLTKSRPRIAEVLDAHVLDRAADMLVMGAYGHSRLREAILGGATRDVLNTTQIPVLMAH